MAFYDGTYTTAKQDGPRRASYPFGNAAIPDVYPVQYDRNMLVLAASYSPQMATRDTITNHLTHSEQFDNGSWGKSSATVSANTQANPSDGATTADSLLETAITADHFIYQAYTATAAAHTFSLFVKPNSRDWALLLFIDSAATQFYGFFNVTTGTVGTLNNATGAILSVGNGWYRCSIMFTPASGAGNAYIQPSTNGSTLSYLGDVTKGLYIWGAQMDRNATARAYISTTSASRDGSAPNQEINEAIEGSDPFAFLVNESEPSIDRAVARFGRRYARPPGDQIIPGNQWVTRPVMHDVKSGSSYAVSFDELQKYSWVFTSRKAISRVASVGASTIPANMPSGNITFVEGGRTLNLPANSSAATTVSQFNSVLTGLTNVAANASTGFLSVVWSGTMTSIAVPSGVEVVAVNGFSATFKSIGTQTTPASTVFESTSHGGTVGDKVALWSNDSLVGTGVVVSVPNTGGFTVMTNDLDAANTLVTHCGFSSQAAACYVNGPKLCTVKRTRKFYLPGVTSGITTYADIPDVTVYTDPVSWLGRIVAGSTYAAIAVSELEQWQGPILTQETSEVQMSDAIDTVTP